jgi:hypothetical protein
VADRCAVIGCGRLVKARHLCAHHYRRYQAGVLTEPHTTLAGFLAHDGTEELVCHCADPEPDGIGQCDHCGRKVVTFVAPPLHDTYRQLYPRQWERALQLSLSPVQMTLFPDIAPDVPLPTLPRRTTT